LSSKNELLGTFTFFCEEACRPNNETVETFRVYNRLAAIALELSKQPKSDFINGRNFSQSEQKQLEHREKYSQLKQALEREEFELYYQPYFGIKTNDIGIEALIRWNHPDLGLLTPASFLDEAEKTGFIIEMEEWVLKQSIQEAMYLRENGLQNLHLSANISAQQFENERFPNLVKDTLESYSFPPEYLTLEITERFQINQNNIDMIDQLKNTGVRISIDDFGTSYSSLQYLKDLPIDDLKIDRSFISDLESNENNRKIVEMIIGLGHQLNLTIVGEGVETNHQFQFLKEMNCNRVQGFLFSKPLPLNEFTQQYLHK